MMAAAEPIGQNALEYVPASRTERPVMSIRCTLSLLRCTAVVAALWWSAGAADGEEPTVPGKRPNLIFLMADDQCTNSLGCYGTPGARTPNLDRLAAEGMTFDRHYDTTAICMASRANVMTGLFEYHSGCNFSHGPLVSSLWEQAYPVLLKQAGYRIGFAGKFGFEVARQPGQRGQLPAEVFDRWGGGPGQTHYETRRNASMARYADEFPHSTRAYGAFGRDFVLESRNDTRPFCLSISFKAPHHPVTPDPVFDEIYRGSVFVKPENFGRENGQHFSLQSRQGRQYERFHSWKYSTDYDGVMARYYQQIYAIDVAVGMIRAALKQAGHADDTIIIYTSDNGFMCGAHGYGSKVLPYEESSRVPLIVLDPRLPAEQRGRRCQALTGNVDFAPTLLELAGLEIPPGLDGRSLVPLLTRPELEIHESLPLINVWGPREVHSLGVVTQSAKYIYWPHAAEGFAATEELYDLSGDPLELRNLASTPERSELLRRMRTLYDRTVADWQATAVEFHGYPQFGTIFSREIPWQEKARHVRDY